MAVCTPRIAVADPAANLLETLKLAREGHARGADLMLFASVSLGRESAADGAAGTSRVCREIIPKAKADRARKTAMTEIHPKRFMTMSSREPAGPRGRPGLHWEGWAPFGRGSRAGAER